MDYGGEMMKAVRAVRPMDARRYRKAVVRKTVDYNSSLLKSLHERIYAHSKDSRDHAVIQASAADVEELELPLRIPDEPSQGFLTRFVSDAKNKITTPICSCTWSPDGRRLITGTQTGELTLWNGLTFNFETILTAHQEARENTPAGASQVTPYAIRCLRWSPDDLWLVSADDKGVVKYWQPSMNNARAFKAHDGCVRDLAFSPSSAKLATASDDKTICLWDFHSIKEEHELKGHGYNVRSVSWHPSWSLLVSGGQDNLIKLWDSRIGRDLHTLHGHKGTVNRVRWNSNGCWFASCGRDQLIKIWDIRKLKELITNKTTHKKEITSLEWHSNIENLFASGSYDGEVHFWLCGQEDSQAHISGAHELAITDIAWHPFGHLMATSSLDSHVKFWTRNRPGDDMKDKHNADQLPAEEKREAFSALHEAAIRTAQTGKQLRIPNILAEYEKELAQMEVEKVNEGIPGIDN